MGTGILAHFRKKYTIFYNSLPVLLIVGTKLVRFTMNI